GSLARSFDRCADPAGVVHWGMSIRAIPFCLTLACAPLWASATAAAVQTAGGVPGPMSVNPMTAGAWQRVVQAQTPAQQAYELHSFLRALATDGRRPAELTFDARDIASGRAVA